MRGERHGRNEETAMNFGMVGLGRMGGNMARRLRRGGHDVAAWNLEREVADALAHETGLVAATTLEGLVGALAPPRVVWLMLPAGDVTERHVETFAALLAPGDVLVDGGNSWYRDSIRRAERLTERSVAFVDAGVSGGVWGLDEGYALMLGGAADAIATLRPYLETLAPAPDRGWLHCGPSGAGHYVKMIHNGIEYGMMQAYAEGFALMRAKQELGLDLAAVAETWRHGSVVRSWLLDLTATFLAADQELADVAPFVADSGEGRWTVVDAVEQGVPAPVTSLALMARFASQGKGDYASKLLARMRESFGGHAVRTRKP
jgi:6-phosphogluconate dehydrogenase